MSRITENDTIAAIATALSPSGIGIVRISGPEAFAVAGRVFCAARGETGIFRQAEMHGNHDIIVPQHIPAGQGFCILFRFCAAHLLRLSHPQS